MTGGDIGAKRECEGPPREGIRQLNRPYVVEGHDDGHQNPPDAEPPEEKAECEKGFFHGYERGVLDQIDQRHSSGAYGAEVYPYRGGQHVGQWPVKDEPVHAYRAQEYIKEESRSPSEVIQKDEKFLHESSILADN